MKIAYTISGIYNSGGMENILIQKANYLSDVLGYDVTIITTDQDGRKSFFNVSDKVSLIDLGINYCKHKGAKCWHLQKLILKRKHNKCLKTVLYKNHYDIVISLMDFDFSFLHKIKDGSKKILEFHFSKYYKSLSQTHPILKTIQRFRADLWEKTIKHYNKFVVLTEEDKTQWKSLNNIVVIPNFIKSEPSQTSLLNNSTVISVGRADYQKGFDLLIKAWSYIHNDFPEWKLNIVGGGDKSELQRLIGEYHLVGSAILKPATPDIANEYLNSSLYVMSSRYEGLPLVLLEAMSYGLPIISFRCPCGPKDILSNSFSTLVEPNDVRALANAIREWISDADRRCKASTYAISHSKAYLKENIMEKWDKLFKEICNDKYNYSGI